ncbi:histidine kinase [Azospirillum sp. TSH100]|uniref:hybrid sensor histidine kinase/response regulator n=1 Tax=Azospirillum sp. TSH100 TaxID=652764 RepID=UPI000D604E08|nr:hybrid sensor histidine kinase/response regulator [Azospirillum sp. TSH100]PWC84064.1 histidine kinase [Azospirillum sp. TSH100]QCG87574.1 hybrid sensor histidine kinase/response regulator [Azospirillum sp. TSH100]
MSGSHDDVGGGGPALLVFGGDGRLADWTPAAAVLPFLAGRLTTGLSAGALEAALLSVAGSDALCGREVLRLAGGGVMWRFGDPSSSTPSGVSPPEARSMPDPAGRLFAAASHDLRQPLAALSLLIGTLDGRLGAKAGEGRDLLHSMAQAVESMRSMVDGHFDLVRLESGLIEPDIRPHAVNGVLMRLALEVAPRFADRGLRFTVMPCSAVVRTDSALLERLLHGLVANALRGAVRGRVLLGCRLCGDRLRIEVWDSGRGLSPQRLAALRTDLAKPAGEAGAALGLDLTLVRGLARKLGLGLDVCAAEGRGTVFAVLVPLSVELLAEGSAGGGEAPGQADGAATPQAASDSGTTDISRTRILVIEDDPMVLAALEALLGQWGCSVVGAESYDMAVERIGPVPGRFDLIISDLRLKGAANGIVAIRQIAKLLDRPVPGMILTGDTDPKRLREARLSGYPLLHKPVAPLALRAAVIRLLGHDPL